MQLLSYSICIMRPIIKNHKDFVQSENDASVKTPLFILRARATFWPGDAKYGLVATKRTLKLAHDRNRAKRLLRVWLRACESELSPEMDYIFIARAPILDASLPDGIDTLKKAIEKIKAIN